MTQRERDIIRAILSALHDLDGGQFTEPQLHAGTNLKLAHCGYSDATLSEFNSVLTLCDRRGWLTGVPGRFGGRKWNINDSGEAALLEL